MAPPNEDYMSGYLPLIVSLVSQKGGVGKSTLARALAMALETGGMKVLLADLDPQQSTSRVG